MPKGERELTQTLVQGQVGELLVAEHVAGLANPPVGIAAAAGYSGRSIVGQLVSAVATVAGLGVHGRCHGVQFQSVCGGRLWRWFLARA
jgi:hypothetical protein